MKVSIVLNIWLPVPGHELLFFEGPGWCASASLPGSYARPTSATASTTAHSVRLQLSDFMGNRMLGDARSGMTTRDLLDGFENYHASQDLAHRDAVSLLVARVVSERRATVSRVGEQFLRRPNDVSKFRSRREFDDYGVVRVF